MSKNGTPPMRSKAAIPGVGDAFAAGKMGVKLATAAPKAAKAIQTASHHAALHPQHCFRPRSSSHQGFSVGVCCCALSLAISVSSAMSLASISMSDIGLLQIYISILSWRSRGWRRVDLVITAFAKIGQKAIISLRVCSHDHNII